MSTNISKEKREQLIAKISEIKAFIEKSADDKNKSNLLSYMGDLQKELINKHYGLIFEEHRERNRRNIERKPAGSYRRKRFVH